MAFDFRERFNSTRRPESGNISETEESETEHNDLVSIAVAKSHHQTQTFFVDLGRIAQDLGVPLTSSLTNQDPGNQIDVEFGMIFGTLVVKRNKQIDSQQIPYIPTNTESSTDQQANSMEL